MIDKSLNLRYNFKKMHFAKYDINFVLQDDTDLIQSEEKAEKVPWKNGTNHWEILKHSEIYYL